MAWQNEMSLIVRHLINDLDSTSYVFPDVRIEEALLVGVQLALHEADFDQDYTVDVDSLSLSPDPTTATPKDSGFVVLSCLKTSCLLLGSELKTHALNAISLKDGPSSIDLRGIVQGLQSGHDFVCEKYEAALIQHKLGDGAIGQAVLSPYAPGSDSIASNILSGRSGYFE